MKKLIIAAVAICTAVMTQAASVSWGGAIATVDGTDTLAAGTQAALLYSSSEFTGAATSLASWTIGSAANNGGSLVATYSLTGDDSSNWTFQGTYSVDGSVDGYYAVLVLNDEKTLASYYDMGKISGTTGASATTDLLLNPGWSSLSGPWLTQGGYTVNVPEPTSGLLMLLGMAGLALKRKRA